MVTRSSPRRQLLVSGKDITCSDNIIQYTRCDLTLRLERVDHVGVEPFQRWAIGLISLLRTIEECSPWGSRHWRLWLCLLLVRGRVHDIAVVHIWRSSCLLWHCPLQTRHQTAVQCKTLRSVEQQAGRQYRSCCPATDNSKIERFGIVLRRVPCRLG